MIIWHVIKHVFFVFLFLITPINHSWMFGAILHKHLFLPGFHVVLKL